MSDDAPFYSPNFRPPPRVPRPGELLFEFIRACDRAPITCELRFHGESYGWEVDFVNGGDPFYAHGAFTTRAAAVRWAEEERADMER